MRSKVVLICALMLLSIISIALAQDTTPEAVGDVVVTDLAFPRGIAFDEAGNLYIAEAGSGGDTLLLDMPEEGLTITGGLSGSVTMVTPDGHQQPSILHAERFHSRRRDGHLPCISTG